MSLRGINFDVISDSLKLQVLLAQLISSRFLKGCSKERKLVRIED